jgi:glutamate N-acetyltransferase / amino-acid N-acetyltransferase
VSLAPPRGFLFSACAAGIKASGKPDLALALAPEGAAAAAMFTRNQVVAAPVIIGRSNLLKSHGQVHAVVVNAGNANCATGNQGLQSAKTVCKELAAHLGVPAFYTFPSSTGIIGVPLPAEKITSALPMVIKDAQASEAGLVSFATAILTTDTRPKTAHQTISFRNQTATLVGVAKGAGMIHPNMATMLVYLFTDIAAGPRGLETQLRPAVDQSFNCISIDGDTSTNDTVLLLASGASGLHLRHVREQFRAALNRVCSSLAAQIVADGEGVKHVVRLSIEQARTRDEARRIARSIANSPLVKTAWAGADPNWGRILAAVGYSGVKVDPSQVNIYLGDQQVCRKGAACDFDKNAAHACMLQPEYTIRVLLGSGKAALDFLSCDLTAEYVHVNADYST